MKTVFHIADGADDIQDATIRYAGGIFDDDSVEIDAVAVVANASGIGSFERTPRTPRISLSCLKATFGSSRAKSRCRQQD
ncbi:hypothetical protein ACFQRB_19265 [Halobaculum litoreum]|uniref:Uncharacterized protein n=1 Tax=Halobaculum litoreum TaxID=3031998 RepID=A0ABD5XS66_9EURY